MLDNRDYMRMPSEGDSWWLRHPAYVQTMAVLILVFILQQINTVYLHVPYRDWLLLTPRAVTSGFVWQFLTFQLFHAGLWHLLGNLVVIYFFGRTVEEQLGRTAFYKIYLLGGVVGGIFQASLMAIFTDSYSPIYFGDVVLGASAGALSLLAASCLIDPNSIVRVDLILPIRAIYILYIETAICLLFTIAPSDHTVAYAAHLGGIVFAVVYMRWDRSGWVYRLKESFPSFKRKSNEKTATLAIAKVRRAISGPKAEVSPQEFISSEVDPILDKISAHGIQSLTDKEREILQNARKKMSKR